ncbi:MAG: hypothetical protein SXQ77_04155, partial [Halobacteria archaeon]|nr:hypothetical protein [Halobacteria archaeon]
MQTLVDSIDAAIGCDYSRDTNQLFFVEYSGKVSRLDLVRSYDSTVSSGTTTLSGTGTFDLDTGTEAPSSGADIWWEQVDSTERYMTPQGDAEIANLGVVNFGSVSHAELQNVAYSDDSINGSNDSSNQLVDGDVFAVKTTKGNLAKVEVLDYGYDIEIRWKTYKLDPAYNVIGTGYTNPEDIVLSSDGQHAYVTERGGDFLRINLSNADRSNANVVASGMTMPHQIALDESRGQAYVVEYTSSDTGELLRIDLTTGGKTTIHSGLDEAVGLLVDSDYESAYISEQSGSGSVIRVEIDSGRREEIVTGLDAPFFLEWADPEESAILTTERDPANRVSKIDLTDLSVVHLFSGV